MQANVLVKAEEVNVGCLGVKQHDESSSFSPHPCSTTTSMDKHSRKGGRMIVRTNKNERRTTYFVLVGGSKCMTQSTPAKSTPLDITSVHINTPLYGRAWITFTPHE